MDERASLRERASFRWRMLRHDAQRRRENWMAALAKALPQELRYWVLVTAGVEHIEDHEEVPAARFTDLAGRMHAKVFGFARPDADALRHPLHHDDQSDLGAEPQASLLGVIDLARERRQSAKPVELPTPSQEMTQSFAFQVVWRTIKDWDIDVGDGQGGATGSHVALILGALAGHYISATFADWRRSRAPRARVDEYVDAPDAGRPEDVTEVLVTAEFRPGPGPHGASVDGERLRDYLDEQIRGVRAWCGPRPLLGRDAHSAPLWTAYIEALQDVRHAVYGEPAE